MILQTSRFQLDLTIPKVMGIVNLTPDSFSDGGALTDASKALTFCEQALKQGADILDLGAESTRPGAVPVGEEEELARLLPVLTEVVKLGVPISVDTYKPAVMQAALDMGCDIINDVWALRQAGAVGVIAGHKNCGVILMHMNGEPQTMQVNLKGNPIKGNVVLAVKDFLSERSQVLNKARVDKSRVAWDVGIGFGKTVEQNFELLAKQTSFLTAGYPLMCAWSRKSSLGAICASEEPVSRMAASVAAAMLAMERGARLLRVHDVKATKDAARVWVAAKKPF